MTAVDRLIGFADARAPTPGGVRMSVERTMQEEADHIRALHYEQRQDLEAKHAEALIEAYFGGAEQAYDLARRSGWLTNTAPESFEQAYALLSHLDEGAAGGRPATARTSTTELVVPPGGAPRQDNFTPNYPVEAAPARAVHAASSPRAAGPLRGGPAVSSRVTLLRPGGKRSPILRVVADVS